MSDRPSFQFYPADWLANTNLRRCSEGARGVWIDVMCVLHGSDEYGVVRWPLADLARAANAPLKLVKELADKGVLKGGDKSAADYRWAPSHAGQKGDEVTLVAAGSGPVWYCSRFVKDEFKRQRRGANTRFTKDNQPPKEAPKPPPIQRVGERNGDHEGDGAISPSLEQELPDPTGLGAGAPVDPLPDPPPELPKPPAAVIDPIWHTGLSFLTRKGVPEKNARSFLGKLKQAVGDMAAGALLVQAENDDITDPVPWLQGKAQAQGNHHANRTTGGRLGLADRIPRPAFRDDFSGDAIAGEAVRIHG